LRPGRSIPSPSGFVECTFHRWSGGASTFKKWVWKAPQASLRLVDGLIGNQETKWQETRDAVTGAGIHHATARVTFKKTEAIAAVAVYEDNRGPASSRGSLKEMVSAHFGITINRRRVGYAVGNTNLVNIFTFPREEAKSLEYFWAGREFASATDGMIRMAELEVYSAEEAALRLDGADEGGLLDGLE
jgi:hypothetical protein